jgi:peptide/nickel transport system permease protein
MKKSWGQFKKNRAAVAGLFVVGMLLMAAIFAPVIAPYDPLKMDFNALLQPPSPSHVFGTDMYGRDIASRILYGAQISLEVGFIIVIIGVGVGVIAGGLAGYSGGVLDTVIMRLVDVLLAFPSILLALLIASVMGPGLVSVMIAVGAVSWLTFARVVRAEILSIKERDFIIAARALGTNDLRILARHVLPNCMAPIIVLATLQMATALISAASLSFLGRHGGTPSFLALR